MDESIISLYITIFFLLTLLFPFTLVFLPVLYLLWKSEKNIADLLLVPLVILSAYTLYHFDMKKYITSICIAYITLFTKHKLIFNLWLPMILGSVGSSCLMLLLYFMLFPKPVEEKHVKTKRISKTRLLKLSKKPHPSIGTLIGVDEINGKEVVITHRETNSHVLVLGPTGTGKTTTLLNFVESCMQNKIPAIFVDGKGDIKLYEKIKSMAEDYSIKFYHFSMDYKSMHYNPLKIGGFTELKDKLMCLSDWTEPHYQFMAERYLQLALKTVKALNLPLDLVKVCDYLEPETLEGMAKKLPEEDARKIYEAIDKSDVSGLVNRIAIFAESEIGKLFEDKGDVIDILKAIHGNEVVLFSLNSQKFPEYSRYLGRLIVSDLKTVSSRLLYNPKDTYVIFDEFNVFAGPQVVDMLTKSRASGFHVIVATQEFSDMDETTMKQVIGNTNVKIIHRQDVAESSELLSSIIGTKEDYEATIQTNEGYATGLGSYRKTRSFTIHPDELKQLKTGEAVIVTKTPRFYVSKTLIRNIG